MIESPYAFEGLPSDLEAMIVVAGDYVEVTGDLRPAVIENAKIAVASARAYRRAGILVTSVLVLSVIFSVGRSGLPPKESSARDLMNELVSTSRMHATADELQIAAVRADRADRADCAWGLVELFQLLQSKRATAIRGVR